MNASSQIVFTALGGGSSIGGSSYLIRADDTVVLIDFGINPNEEPTHTFEKLIRRAESSGVITSINDISAVMLTHAHTDHSGLLPALYHRFRGGRVPPFYASNATKSLLCLVYENVLKFSRDVPFRQSDVDELMDHLDEPRPGDCIDWYNPGLGKFWFYPNSHLLGAVMVELEIGGQVILCTGDLRVSQTPSLPPSAVPEKTPHLLIVDGTYASSDSTRQPGAWDESRQQLYQLIDKVVEKRSVLLLPSFALGRSQDVLALVLEYLEAQRDSSTFVYLDGQSARVTRHQYRQFRQQLSINYRDITQHSWWRIKWSDDEQQINELIDTELKGYPAVVIASSGMLLPGSASREWAEALMLNPDNEVAFTGYLIEDISEEVFDHGVLGKKRWPRPPNRLGFSSHASIQETFAFVEKLQPEAVGVVHCGSGNQYNAGSLVELVSRLNIPGFVGCEDHRFTITSKGVCTDEY